MEITTSGSLSKQDALNQLKDALFAHIKEKLADVAKTYGETFVKNALSQKGPNTLGQVTGNLARSFESQAIDSGPVGGITAGIVPGSTFIYGSYQEQKKMWIEEGIQTSQEVLLQSIQEAINESIKDVS